MHRFWGHKPGLLGRLSARINQIIAVLAIVGIAALVTTIDVSSKFQTTQISFTNCQFAPRINCVVDGDTIWLGGEKIRIADIDTPEIFSPKCSTERQRGQKASGRLLQLLNAGKIEVVAYQQRDEDRYGRKLRVITRDGKSLGDILVAEGLARHWDGARHSWCI